MNNNKTGIFISKLRKEKGLTQKELGNILYVTDKAVSKWERGLSLPDITILTKLAETLNVEVIDILNGEKTNKKDVDVEKLIEETTIKLKQKQQTKIKKLLTIIIIIIVILISILFRTSNLGYTSKTINYHHSITGTRKIEIGIPKLSFLMKNRDYSYSYKNLRSSTVLEKEIKDYLKTLTYSTCNDTIYYYNKDNNFSIIEYSVKNNYLYSTISYAIVDNDYCYTKKVKYYEQKLGGLKRIHSLNATIEPKDKNLDSILVIMFEDGIEETNNIYDFKAKLTIYNLEKTKDNKYNQIMLEESTGDIEIKEDKLYYYRTNIKVNSKNIKIPEVSIFEIYKERLYLTDNYLSTYHKEDIILK